MGSALEYEQAEIARIQRETDNFYRSLGPPEEPTGGERIAEP